MTSAELYELVKGHEDVWGGMFRPHQHDPGEWCWLSIDNGQYIDSRILMATMVGLFALATECGVREYKNHGVSVFAAAIGRLEIGHGPTPLAALVNAREAMGKGNKETFNG